MHHKSTLDRVEEMLDSFNVYKANPLTGTIRQRCGTPLQSDSEEDLKLRTALADAIQFIASKVPINRLRMEAMRLITTLQPPPQAENENP